MKAIHGDELGRRKWVILVTSATVYFLIATDAVVASITLVDLLFIYSDYKVLLGWLSGSNLALGLVCGTLLGYVISRFPHYLVGICAALLSSSSMVTAAFSNHPVVLFITFGVLVGLCNGVFFIVPSICLQRGLPNHRNLTQGVSFAAQSLAFLCCPPVVRLLLDHYSWRGTLIIEAGINLHIIPCFLLLRFPEAKHGECSERAKDIPCENEAAAIGAKDTSVSTTDEVDAPEVHNANKVVTAADKKTSSLCELFTDSPATPVFLLGLILVQAGNIIPFTLIPLQGAYLGVSKLKGALLITVAAGVSLVGRVVFGVIGDRPCSNPLIMSGVGGLLGGGLMAMVPLARTYEHLALLVTILAVPSSSFMATWGAALALIVDKRHLVIGTSTGLAAFGLGMLLPFGGTGWLLEVTGHPVFIFIIFGCLQVVGALMFLGIHLHRTWTKRCQQQPMTSL